MPLSNEARRPSSLFVADASNRLKLKFDSRVKAQQRSVESSAPVTASQGWPYCNTAGSPDEVLRPRCLLITQRYQPPFNLAVWPNNGNCCLLCAV